MSELREDVVARIEAIERGYEFFLAYAAQGLPSHQGSKVGGQLREFLDGMTGALDGLAGAVGALVAEEDRAPADAWQDFLDVIERDAAAALAVVRLVSGQEGISSQLVDNLNANIHVRAVLTDLFVVGELVGA